jgi:hypothetical protein
VVVLNVLVGFWCGWVFSVVGVGFLRVLIYLFIFLLFVSFLYTSCMLGAPTLFIKLL